MVPVAGLSSSFSRNTPLFPYVWFLAVSAANLVLKQRHRRVGSALFAGGGDEIVVML